MDFEKVFVGVEIGLDGGDKTVMTVTCEGNVLAVLEDAAAEAMLAHIGKVAQAAADEERERLLSERMDVHSYNTITLADGRQVIIHPDIPPHFWDGDKFVPFDLRARSKGA